MTCKIKPIEFLWILIQEFEPYRNPLAFGPFPTDKVDDILREKGYTVNERGFLFDGRRGFRKKHDSAVTLWVYPYEHVRKLI